MTEIEKAIEILIDMKNGIGCYTRNYEKFYSDDEKKQIKALEMAISELYVRNKKQNNLSQLIECNDRAIEILKLYKQRLEESVSTELGNDIQAFEMAISALENKHISETTVETEISGAENEPYFKKPEDLISRNDVINMFNTMDRYKADKLILQDTNREFPLNEVFIVDDCYELLEQLPTYSAEEDTAEWITKWDEEEREERHYCTNCNDYQLFQTEFCPHCGAKMKGDI